MRFRLGRHEYDENARLVMAIVNRTPDSFYDKGLTWAEDVAFDRVREVVEQGADIVDIGGIKAAPGAEIDAAEEMRRVVGFVEKVRGEYPDLVVSVDTWRSEVARAVCEVGADVINDAWGGADPALPEVAAGFGVALVCTHTGGVTPRTRPHRIEYDDVVADVVASLTGQAERAVSLGVDRRAGPHRPRARLRQEQLALPRGDPAAGRAPSPRVAGAGVVVQQGLRRRVARPAGRGAADRDPRDDGDLRLAGRTGLPRPRGPRDPRGPRHGVGDRGRPSAGTDHPGARVIRTVSVVPSAPLLLPEYAGRQDAGTPLREACVSALRPLGPSRGGAVVLLLVASDREPRSTKPALGRRVGELLLRLAGVVAADVVEIPWDAPVDRCRSVGEALAAPDTVVDLVVVADGSARRGEKAPGHLDERSFAVDDEIVDALSAADPARLLALDPGLCADLLVQGRAPLQVAAAAMGEHAAYRCVAMEPSDPYGVRYVVARLERVAG